MVPMKAARLYGVQSEAAISAVARASWVVSLSSSLVVHLWHGAIQEQSSENRGGENTDPSERDIILFTSSPFFLSLHRIDYIYRPWFSTPPAHWGRGAPSHRTSIFICSPARNGGSLEVAVCLCTHVTHSFQR